MSDYLSRTKVGNLFVIEAHISKFEERRLYKLKCLRELCNYFESVLAFFKKMVLTLNLTRNC